MDSPDRQAVSVSVFVKRSFSGHARLDAARFNREGAPAAFDPDRQLIEWTPAGGPKISVFPHSPICESSVRTDLGEAFDDHNQAYGRDAAMRLVSGESGWLNVMRGRAQRTSDSHLHDLTDQMLGLLRNPAQASGSFQNDFLALYESAGRHAYPLAWSLLAEQRALASMTRDYTLLCFDAGMVRLIEDDAVDDKQMRTFVESMLEKLRGGKKLPGA
jgi:hypothetical protein